MRPSRIIESPTTFVVEDYTPGLVVDFRHPAETSDLERLREAVDLEPWRQLDFETVMARADELLLRLGVSEEPGDLAASLRRFAPEADLRQSLATAAARLAGIPRDAPGLDMMAAVLTRTGVFRRAPHHPVRLYCHDPDAVTELEDQGTHFGYVLDGDGLELELPDGRRYPLYPSSSFCVPGAGLIQGPGRVEVMTSFGYHGVLVLGGRLEPWGRLRYIDGCTDTLLVPPVKLGDPCYNALYFPPGTEQTQHTHPSLRAGMVAGGAGTCKTPHGDHDLKPGRIFFLPPETWHSFHTGSSTTGERAALTVIAFHPDSDFGPTDDDHPMLNRTYFRFLHRLRSAQRQTS